MWLAPRRNVSNVAGLQVFNTLRFVTFLIIAIVFTKIGLSKEQIGLFEISVFMVNLASFFWVTGIIQAFLPLYKGSKTFGELANESKRKSPEIFNTFIVLVFFSLIVFFIGQIIQVNCSCQPGGICLRGKKQIREYIKLCLYYLHHPAGCCYYPSYFGLSGNLVASGTCDGIYPSKYLVADTYLQLRQNTIFISVY